MPDENEDQFDPSPGTVGTKLAGRVALVTGGTRGIGAAIGTSLASQGATIAAGFSGNVERAEEYAAGFLSRFGTPISVHQGNIGVPDDCRRVVEEVLDHHDRLDILVNNAGITLDRTVLKMTDEDWQKVIGVNLSGTFFMSQAALRHMLERGTGRIINLSSIVGEIGNIGQTNYAASKSGLLGMTKSMALEAAFLLKRAGKLGIAPGLTINVVSPGVIATEMVKAIPDKIRDNLYANIPVSRFGEPEEIARVVHFLAADASSYITGQVWAVNGGMDM
jgi:NAD(P)-dependent dehydrogenase (short-subunit alcohol dehydrogenase family)